MTPRRTSRTPSGARGPSRRAVLGGGGALALSGLAPTGTLVISAIEHAAVREAAAATGRQVIELPVSRDGG